MTSGWADGSRVRITVEATFRVSDVGALTAAAMERVEAAEFTGYADTTADEEKAEQRALVRSSPAEALLWIAEPEGLVHGVTGVESEESISGAEMVPDVDVPPPIGPDFVRLFPVCRCGSEHCDTCSGYQLTPRSAAVIWSIGQMLADHGFDDVEEHGDDPCHDDGSWSLFDEYPPLTWREDAVWRRRAARSYDDLSGDIAGGKRPTPTCAGEEMALHLVLRHAEAAVDDEWSGLESTFADLPEHDDDLDWSMLGDVLFQDHDILALFDLGQDGIEDPEAAGNLRIGMGDYRPSAWFRPFNNADPRDGRRSFRR